MSGPGTIRKARRRGMTLIELAIAVGISTLVLGAVTTLTLFSARGFAALSNYVDLDAQSRNAMDMMSQEIRQADALTSYATNKLIFAGTDPGTGASYTLTYAYDPVQKQLTRTKGSQQQVLLKQCTSLNFAIFQRNLTNGTDSPIPTVNASECKLVQLTWLCSRDILRQTANTESMQSAEVVIRKK